jgi:hypothetical protein
VSKHLIALELLGITHNYFRVQHQDLSTCQRAWLGIVRQSLWIRPPLAAGGGAPCQGRRHGQRAEYFTFVVVLVKHPCLSDPDGPAGPVGVY